LDETPILIDDHGGLYRTPDEPDRFAAFAGGADWYPPATRQTWGVDGGSIVAGYGRKGCLHSTETTGFPEYDLGQKAPHNTVSLVGSRVEWRQHVPYSRASRALRHDAGTEETNRTGVIQVEIVWYAANGASLPDALVESLAAWTAWLETEHGIPRDTSVHFTGYPGPGRLSEAAWAVYVGWLGHQHVPCGNTHWDPGAVPIATILEGGDMPLTDTDLTAVEARAKQALIEPLGTASSNSVASKLNALLDKLDVLAPKVSALGNDEAAIVAAVGKVTETVGSSQEAMLGALAAMSLNLTDEQVANLADQLNMSVEDCAKAVRLELARGLTE
jgi:hypothetical protein